MLHPTEAAPGHLCQMPAFPSFLWSQLSFPLPSSLEPLPPNQHLTKTLL